MTLQMFCRPWFITGTAEDRFALIVEDGYNGIEDNLPAPDEAARFRALLAWYRLPYIAVIRTAGDDHLDSFKRQLDAAMAFEPVMVNCQTGRDCLDFSAQCRFFEQVLRYEEQLPVPVGHETHRKRATFTPWNTDALLAEFPQMRLTADFSHWCCVTESLLEDHAERMQRIARHVIHIHCRVGYKEGPQVPHPAAPEYAAELAVHECWWKAVITYMLSQDAPFLSATPEYGHAGNRYMHTLPFTDQPLSDCRAVCLWAKERFRALYEQVAPGC